MKQLLFITTVLFSLLCTVVKAQNRNAGVDKLKTQAKLYGLQHPDALLFAHLDKTVYVESDVIWFSAYLLNVDAHNLAAHQVLSVALVNSNDKKVAAQGRFLMEMGLSFGNLAIPDTVAPGHYSFVAYTNRLLNNKPEISFTQRITLKSAKEAAFNVALALDTSYKNSTHMRVVVNAGNNNGPLNGAVINYSLGEQALHVQGKAKTDAAGNFSLLLPKDHITPKQHNLEVQVTSGKENKILHLDIPFKGEQTSVRFYPEGGHLVMGLRNKIGFEVKTAVGIPIKTQAMLLANGKDIGVLNTDIYGMGTFDIAPKPDVKYTIKLLDNGDDKLYELPAALTVGVVIRMENALPNDTLNFNLSTGYRGRLFTLVHNFRQIFYTGVNSVVDGGQNFTIDVSAVPRGLATLTILDSLQRPVAERLFFAHYKQKPQITIGINNSEPGPRQKVNVKIKLRGNTDMPANGVVSIACVQNSRLEIKNDNNIENYTYLQSQLNNLPLKETLFGKDAADLQYLNELLLVRGWSRYKWLDLAQASPNDTAKTYQNVTYNGKIEHLGRRIKKPVQAVLLKDSARVYTVISDNSGDFTLKNHDLYTLQNHKLRMMVSGHGEDYVISLKDPYIKTDSLLATNVEPVLFEQPYKQNTTEFNLTGVQHVTRLHEVTIRPDNDRLHSHRPDYVCRYHVLNCRKHANERDNHAPQRGEMVYAGRYILGLTPYNEGWETDAKPGMISLNGIYTAKEFYGADYNYSNPDEPDYMSTICWRQGVILNSHNTTELSFYTSDVTGKFRIVIQGVGNDDVLYGEAYFEVKKKAN